MAKKTEIPETEVTREDALARLREEKTAYTQQLQADRQEAITYTRTASYAELLKLSEGLAPTAKRSTAWCEAAKQEAQALLQAL